MITAIRQVRRAKRMTLEEVALRCAPPTTAQTIGRLETGMRTVSVDWLNRIADALGVDAADLVKLPDRPDVPVAAILDASGAVAPRAQATVVPPHPRPELVALLISVSTGDYRAGDQLWCSRLAPDAYGSALNRDVLVPRPPGKFLFGRLIASDDSGLHILPVTGNARAQIIAPPPWIAVATTLIRPL